MSALGISSVCETQIPLVTVDEVHGSVTHAPNGIILLRAADGSL